MLITDFMAKYPKMQGEFPDNGDEVSDIHNREVRGLNAELKQRRKSVYDEYPETL